MDDSGLTGVREWMPFMASIAAFALAAVTVDVHWRVGHVIVAAALGVLVIIAARAGRATAVSCAAMAAFSFDFFQVQPVRVLHGLTLALCVAGYGALAISTTLRRRDSDGGRELPAD